MGIGWWIAGAAGVLWIGALLRHRSLDLPPGDDDATLVRLAQAGHRIEAIRRHRARHGSGLQEAKEAVERLARGGRSENPAPSPRPAPSAEVEALVRGRRHLEAIKAYREAHPDTDLAVAKEVIDQLRQRLES